MAMIAGPLDEINVEALGAAVLAGDRAQLARAITLVESRKSEHRKLATQLVARLAPYAGHSHRLGITGVPGVGKSTLIDQLGLNLIADGRRVAVLAVDPTSGRSGGSILGDKTRMTRLSAEPNAFIRPSPTSGTLGGVARRTRETILLCEAAGFDIVIVETVGVGQSEVTVAGMVDMFIVLLLPGGGDDLQGIKKGIIELADLLAINKADGDLVSRAGLAAADYANALHILKPTSAHWSPPVLTISGLQNQGLDRLWAAICDHQAKMQASGDFQSRRQAQAVLALRESLSEAVLAHVLGGRDIKGRIADIEGQVRRGHLQPDAAVDAVMAILKLGPPAG